MINRFFRKYLSIIFIFATFIGTFHHHHDFKQHNDCQICSVQSNMGNADMPTEVEYLSYLDNPSESIITQLNSLPSKKTPNFLHARAPPHLS